MARVCAVPKRKRLASCLALVRTNVKAHKGLFARGTAPSGYGPADLQSAYSLPSATAGSGETVAIVDAYDDPNAEADLQLYRQQYGLPVCDTANGCFAKVNQEGQQGSYPAQNTGWAYEESLDVDMVSAICPNCHILLVEANSNSIADLGASVQEAVKLGAKYISNSYGASEYASETSADQYYNHPGVVVTASAGDGGYGVNFPSASQYVTAVGGTTLTKDASVPRGWTETVWGSASGGSGTGSGCSAYEPKPAWQHDSGCANRTTADVSADANPATGVAVYDSLGGSYGAGWLVFGGTSVSSPVIASTYALAGSPEAGTYPSSYPYLHSGGLNDVTSGANGTCTPSYLCTAGPGYDGPTGLGTPAGVTAFAPVGAGTLAGTVTDAATGKPIAGATVSVGSTTAATSSTGTYSAVVAAGADTVTARAFGYVEKTATGVQVTQGQTTTQNFALATAATVTLSGTVTAGSGHGWPLFSAITIDGDPNGPVYTDPYTGHFSVSLPGQTSYDLTVAPVYPGYVAKNVTVAVGTSNLSQNVAVTVDPAACTAPGYAISGGTCAPVAGGLVDGVITDANTGKPVNGVTVTSDADTHDTGTSAATADPAVPGGFYWLFSSHSGAVTFTTSRTGYKTESASANVTANAVNSKDWVLKAGQLAVTPGSVSATETLGQTVTRKITFTNNGSVALHLDLGTQAGGITLLGQAKATGAPLSAIKGHFNPQLAPGEAVPWRAFASPVTGREGGAADWAHIASYPIPIYGNAAAYDPQTGEVYSFGGYTSGGTTAKGYVFNPATSHWSAIAPAPQALYLSAGAFVDGTVYMIGGLTGAGTPSAAVYAYTPGADRWSQVAALPGAASGPMAAVLGGQLYVVGGCAGSCQKSALNAVYRYTPGSNTWSQLDSYPVAAGYGACAGIDDQVVCTGGSAGSGLGGISATYIYDPASNTWRQGADMPSDRGAGYWGMSYAGANGQLQIAGGVTAHSTLITNEAHEYNPVTNTWATLPSTNTAEYDQGGACGFYQVGGGPHGTSAQVLPGYAQCDGAHDTPWLTEHPSGLDLAPGQSATVTVTLNSAKISQPGTYTATLWAATDTPYPVTMIPITLRVNPPAGWQKISGTVTDASGTPIADATVAISRTATNAGGVVPGQVTAQPGAVGQDAFALRTNPAGYYQWWLSSSGGRLQVSAAKDYYQPQAKAVTLTRSPAAAINFALVADPGTSVYQPAASGHRGARRHAARASARTRAASRAAARLASMMSAPVKRACPPPKRGFASCLSLVRTNVPSHKGLFPRDAAPAGYGPADLQSAYSLPSATAGSGETVAVVDAYDDPNAEADLQLYRQQYGLPVCDTANGCFQKVNQEGKQGSYPPGNAGWALEESLDIQMVSAICPKCHILLVEANSATISNLGDATNEAVALGAKYVSNSYGASEASVETKYNKYWDHPGVVVTASAGDSGYGVEFPAASPDVTSVGGTTLTPDVSTSRGWTEAAWGSSEPFYVGGGTGSGCSRYETAKPVWQRDPGCANRTVADVSADANPRTGVAVYDTFGAGGWVEVGGTSVSSPLIASTYALAGTPAAGTYPASYPYLHATGLNDLTSGANGTCSPSYLCTARPGYDGPTGLGTPDGVAAFSPVRYGIVSGTVTDASTGKPLAGAWVSSDGLTAVATRTGAYTLAVPVGTRDVTATYYGDAAKTASKVTVAQGQTTTENLTLAKAARVTVSGTVTDGSGHGWSLYAKITLSGVGHAQPTTYYTDPFTGKYSFRLPGRNTYTLTIAPKYPGYAAKTVTITVGTAAVLRDVTLTVPELACLKAPGYTYSGKGGVYADFTGWTGGTPQDGWKVQNNNTTPGWVFGDPPLRQLGGVNPTGGTGGYAIATPLASSQFAAQDTSLVTPALDLSGVASPKVIFNDYQLDINGNFDISVDLSLDGGNTWTTVWQQTSVPGTYKANQVITIPIAQAAGKTSVEVRFHYAANGASIWALDNVLVGAPRCTRVPGGLVAGVLSDANTGQPVNGATVASVSQPSESGTSVATGDAALPGGFYSLFSPAGAIKFTVTDGRYAPATGAVNVTANSVTRKDWVLQAGRLTMTPGAVSATESLGHATARRMTFTNNGGAPLQVALGEQAGGFTPTGMPSRGGPGAAPAAGATSWGGIAPYPTPIVNNAVAYDSQTGDIYSVGGQDSGGGLPGQTTGPCPGYGITAASYVYDASTQTWNPIAPAPQPLQSPSAAFVNGTLYVVGGFGCRDYPSAAVYAYTPGSNTWERVASLPTAVAAPGIAVLDGKLYAVGGCGGPSFCSLGQSQKVYRYTPATGTWRRLANYPVYGGAAYVACAGIDGQIVCAGGYGAGGNILDSTYRYNPRSNTWTEGAALPYPDFQMSYSGANGQLQIAGGMTADASSDQVVTDRVSQYDPATNTWTALPSLSGPEWGGGGSCGLYVIGGGTTYDGASTTKSQVLPGYSQCDGAGDTGWLSAKTSVLTLAPGQTVTVTVTLDSAKVAQPGTYTANLWAASDTPYPVTVVPVTMRVTPPSKWGLLRGRVTGAAGRTPIAGATVQVYTHCAAADACGGPSFTLRVGSDGSYQWWLPTSDGRLLVIAAEDGWVQRVAITGGGLAGHVPATVSVTGVRGGHGVVVNFRLARFRPPLT